MRCRLPQTLQLDAEACQAALRAAELVRASTGSGAAVDTAALQQAMQQQQRALKEAAEASACVPCLHLLCGSCQCLFLLYVEWSTLALL